MEKLFLNMSPRQSRRAIIYSHLKLRSGVMPRTFNDVAGFSMGTL